MAVAHVVGRVTALIERRRVLMPCTLKLNAVCSFSKHHLLMEHVTKDFFLGSSAHKTYTVEPCVLPQDRNQAAVETCHDDTCDMADLDAMRRREMSRRADDAVVVDKKDPTPWCEVSL